MPSRLTAHHLTALAIAAVTLVGLVATPPVAAQSGNGLYEPFPEAAVKERAQRYVDRLRERTREPQPRYSDGELAAGVFPRAGPGGASLRPDAARPGRGRGGARAGGAGEARARAGGPGAASARAGAGVPTEPGLPLTVQLLLLVAGLSLPAWALARRTRMRAA